MTARSVLVGMTLAILGTALTAGTYWLLLNVPESNALSLMLTAVLGVLLPIVAGLTTSAVLAAAGGAGIGRALTQSVRGLAGFAGGLVLFAGLWIITTTIDGQWTLHAGEIDAVMLRYAGTANTAWIHNGVNWLMWLVRWGVGLSLVAGLTTSGVMRTGLLRGLGLASAPLPLATTIASLLTGYLLWPLAYWRPKALPTNTAELWFVGAKLAALVAMGALLMVLTLHAFRRGAEADATAPPLTGQA